MIEPTMEPPASFEILTVCTGNVCRSPLAAGMLRNALRDWPAVTVASAGTGALVGEPMTSQTLDLARAAGVDEPQAHVARALSLEQLRGADLVLALTRAHRSEIVSMLPRGARHTFTVRELARLLAAVTAEDLESVAAISPENTAARFAELVDVAAGLRGFVPPPLNEEDDDVVDPYRRGDDVYATMASQLAPAVETIANSLLVAATVAPRSV